MGLFILRRFGVMLLTALCLTYIVFFMTNLYPNLEKLAKTQGNFRMSDEAVASFLEDRGYLQSTPRKYLERRRNYISTMEVAVLERRWQSDPLLTSSPELR